MGVREGRKVRGHIGRVGGPVSNLQALWLWLQVVFRLCTNSKHTERNVHTSKCMMCQLKSYPYVYASVSVVDAWCMLVKNLYLHLCVIMNLNETVQ